MKNSPRKKEDKKELYRKAELELVRKAELERKDLDLSNEFDAAIYSTWYLLDPFETGKRDSVGTTDDCVKQLPRKLTGKLDFTAHSHHNEPLTSSPDDLAIYQKLSRYKNKMVHFIVDRFFCKKVK